MIMNKIYPYFAAIDVMIADNEKMQGSAESNLTENEGKDRIRRK